MCFSDSMETVIHSADAFAPVGYLRFTRMHTEDKREVRFHLKTSTHFICPRMHACDDRTSGFLQYSFGKCSFCAEDVWRLGVARGTCICPEPSRYGHLGSVHEALR